MINTQTQIDSLIDLAVIQRTELKQLIESLPQLRDHLSSEIERNLEEIEPAIRSELEQFVAARALDTQAKTSAELSAKLDAMARNLESTTAAKYSVLMSERAENANLLAKAEARIAEAASALPGTVKGIVTDELSRFPRAGEIDQLRKEFAEPRGLNPRGRWEPGATYYKLDLVAYNGDSYVANEETSEKPNRNSSKWTLNAARGQAGGGGFMSPAIGDYTASMITNVPAGTIAATNVQDAINELAADVDVSQNTLDAFVTNAESVAITKGQVVYAFGATGNRMSVKLAFNTGDATSAKTIGVVLDSSIAAGATGNIRCVGVVDGLTLGSYTEGNTVYLGATAGSITATKPYAPNHLVYVGIVERANNGNGELYVKIQNGYELDEIHDVQITSAPLAGALLMRDATNSLWKANRLTGTANQVTVTNADTAVTLSLPTSLASVDSLTASTSTPLTLTGGSTGGVAGASIVLGAGTSGTGAISTGNDYSFTAVRTSGTNNAIARGLMVRHTTTLDMADSFGAALTLAIQDNAGVSNPIADIAAIRSGADNTGGLVFRNYTTGTAAEVARFAATTGNLLIGTTTDAANLAGGLVINGSGTASAASSTTTGALRVTGGVGVSGAGYFGGDVTISKSSAKLTLNDTADTTWSLRASAGYLTFGNTTNAIDPLSLTGSTLASAVLNLSSTKSASSSTVGALTIGNGTAATNVAIGGGNVNAGGTLVVGGAASVGAAVSTGLGFNVILDPGTLTYGAANAWLGARIRPARAGTTGNAFGVSSQLEVTSGTQTKGATFMSEAPSGTITSHTHFYANSSGSRVAPTGNYSLYAESAAGPAYIGDATASTGVGSGALQVAGGIYAGAASVFGGLVTVSAAAPSIEMVRTGTNDNRVYWKTAGTYNWSAGIYGGGTNFVIRNENTPANPLTIDYTTNAATFAGAVTAGANIVASSSGTNSLQSVTSATNAYSGLILNNTGTSGRSFLLGTGGSTFADASFQSSFVIYDATLGATRLKIDAGGAVTIAGTVIHTLSATPASASATGTVGTMSWDANYIYICTATNTWKRVAIATW